MKKKKQKILKNIEVEEGDIFIKVPAEDSLETKKQLLEVKESLIEAQIASEKFKMQRKEEALRRQDAKRIIRETVQVLNEMMTELPRDIKVKIREERPKVFHPKPLPKVEVIKPVAKPIIVKQEEIKPTKMSDLERELDRIKSKLSGMQ